MIESKKAVSAAALEITDLMDCNSRLETVSHGLQRREVTNYRQKSVAERFR